MPHISRRHWPVAITVLALFLAAGCASLGDRQEAAGSRTAEETISFVAEVQWIPLEGGFFGLVAEDGRKFLPLDLPAELRRDGLKVRVKGRPKQVMTIFMWGTPLEIQEIESYGS